MEFNRQEARRGFGGGDADNSLIRRHRNEPPHVFDPDFEEEEDEDEMHRVQPRVGIVEYPPVQLIDIEEPLPRPERVERPSRTRHRTSRRARDPARERVLISVPCVIPTPRSNQRMIPGSQMICETQPEPLARRAGGGVERNNGYARERNAPWRSSDSPSDWATTPSSTRTSLPRSSSSWATSRSRPGPTLGRSSITDHTSTCRASTGMSSTFSRWTASAVSTAD